MQKALQLQSPRAIAMFIMAAFLSQMTKSQVYNNTCVQYPQNDPVFRDKYCGDFVTWSIPQTQYESEAPHQNALKLYKNLFDRYNGTAPGTYTAPLPSCLGIARHVMCSYAFSYCADGSSQTVVCERMCTTFKTRCPDQMDIYDVICKNQSSTSCSKGQLFSGYASIFYLGMILLGVLMQ